MNPPSQSQTSDAPEKKQPRRKSNPILRTNLSIMAIAFQTGLLFACTQPVYRMVDGERIPDTRLTLILAALLALCSLWMVFHLTQEPDRRQRIRNMLIEGLCCCIQLTAALFTYTWGLGVVGLACMIGVMLFYLLYVNPRFMNRPFGKKQEPAAEDPR